jgi:hypothetical protein
MKPTGAWAWIRLTLGAIGIPVAYNHVNYLWNSPDRDGSAGKVLVMAVIGGVLLTAIRATQAGGWRHGWLEKTPRWLPYVYPMAFGAVAAAGIAATTLPLLAADLVLPFCAVAVVGLLRVADVLRDPDVAPVEEAPKRDVRLPVWLSSTLIVVLGTGLILMVDHRGDVGAYTSPIQVAAVVSAYAVGLAMSLVGGGTVFAIVYAASGRANWASWGASWPTLFGVVLAGAYIVSQGLLPLLTVDVVDIVVVLAVAATYVIAVRAERRRLAT